MTRLLLLCSFLLAVVGTELRDCCIVGEKLANQGALHEAAFQFTQCTLLPITPEDDSSLAWLPFNNLAHVVRHLGSEEEANFAMKRALSFNPKYNTSLFLAAVSQFLRLHQRELILRLASALTGLGRDVMGPAGLITLARVRHFHQNTVLEFAEHLVKQDIVFSVNASQLVDSVQVLAENTVAVPVILVSLWEVNELIPGLPLYFKMAELSKRFRLSIPAALVVPPSSDLRVILLWQPYISPHKARFEELKSTFCRNVENQWFSEIVALTEQLLPFEEWCGRPMPSKLRQVVVIDRLRYSHAFEFANRLIRAAAPGVKQVFVLSNADIAFDDTLQFLHLIHSAPVPQDSRNYFALLNQRRAFALTRWEEQRQDLLFWNPRIDSQDVWVWSFEHEQELIEATDFELGTPGCDNRIADVWSHHGVDILNPCIDMRTLHVHLSNWRTYDTGGFSVWTSNLAFVPVEEPIWQVEPPPAWREDFVSDYANQ